MRKTKEELNEIKEQLGTDILWLYRPVRTFTFKDCKMQYELDYIDRAPKEKCKMDNKTKLYLPMKLNGEEILPWEGLFTTREEAIDAILQEILEKGYCDFIGKTLEEIAELLERDGFFTVEESLTYYVFEHLFDMSGL